MLDDILPFNNVFLRYNTRNKDGKEHRYWSVVENRRLRFGHTTQRTVLYLGEINDTQQSGIPLVPLTWVKVLLRGHRRKRSNVPRLHEGKAYTPKLNRAAESPAHPLALVSIGDAAGLLFRFS